MLAAIIQNLQNVTPKPKPLPMVKIDRGGGGALWPRYEIVDIIAATAAFPELAGEDPVARAARRTRWIGEALPRIKEERERREAAAFLAGAELGGRAATEALPPHAQLSLEKMIEVIDKVRAQAAADAPPVPRARGQYSASSGTDIAGVLLVGVLIGGAIGLAIRKRR